MKINKSEALLMNSVLFHYIQTIGYMSASKAEIDTLMKRLSNFITASEEEDVGHSLREWAESHLTRFNDVEASGQITDSEKRKIEKSKPDGDLTLDEVFFKKEKSCRFSKESLGDLLCLPVLKTFIDNFDGDYHATLTFATSPTDQVVAVVTDEQTDSEIYLNVAKITRYGDRLEIDMPLLNKKSFEKRTYRVIKFPKEWTAMFKCGVTYDLRKISG